MGKYTIEQERLVEDNIRLSYHIARKWSQKLHGQLKWEDLVSAAMFGLAKAALKFNPDIGVKFATYSAKCMENEILMEIRKLNRRNEVLQCSFTNMENDNKNGWELIQARTGAAKDNVKEWEESAILKESINKVSEKKKNLRYLMMLSYQGKTQREMSAITGLSQSYISRLMNRMKNDITAYIS